MKLQTIFLATAIALAALTLTGCGSARKATETGTTGGAEYAYSQRVAEGGVKAQAITAKVKVELNAGGRNVSLTGNLRMYRDDVIQLSVAFLGMEVGRMEFTTDEVLVIDRVHKEYVRVPYSRVSFLSKARLDFYTLQSLFWNEIFIPGTTDLVGSLDRFRTSQSGAYTQLNLTDTPQLEYAFLTTTATAKPERTTIKSRNISEPTQVVWRYGSFAPLAGSTFPGFMELKVTGTAKEYSLGLTLRNTDTSTGWERRTTVSDKYTEKNIDEILGKLMSM